MPISDAHAVFQERDYPYLRTKLRERTHSAQPNNHIIPISIICPLICFLWSIHI